MLFAQRRAVPVRTGLKSTSGFRKDERESFIYSAEIVNLESIYRLIPFGLVENLESCLAPADCTQKPYLQSQYQARKPRPYFLMFLFIP